MKINKLLLLGVLSMFVFSCSDDKMEELSSDASRLQNPNSEFAFTYKGIFTNLDGSSRGTVLITVDEYNLATAQLKLSTGDIIELSADQPMFSESSDVTFTSTDGNISWKLATAVDGSEPSISAINYNGAKASILVAQETSLSPVDPITGTYSCSNCQDVGVGFAPSGNVWNFMSIGEGDNSGFMLQISYGGRIHTSTSSSQSECEDDGVGTLCSISGSLPVYSYTIDWSGTHLYGTSDNCSSVFGTWSSDFGSAPGAEGTFVSDSDCGVLAPPNDLCASAMPVTPGTPVTGLTTYASNSDSPSESCGFVSINTAAGVWYTFTGTGNDIEIDTEGSDYDTKLALYSGTCGELVCIDGDDDGGTGLLSYISLEASTPGETYTVLVTGFGGNTGSYVLNVTENIPPAVPDNDLCSNAFVIDCDGTDSGDTTSAASDASLPSCTTSVTTAPGVWYMYTATADLDVTVDTNGSSFDTKLGVFSGSCGTYTCIGTDDDGGVGTQSEVTFEATSGTTYYFYVTGFSANAGEYVINVECNEPAVPVVFTLTPACGEFVVDNGNTTANYSSNSTDTYLMDAGASNTVSLTFSEFDIEDGWDYMYIYDGADTSAPAITMSVGGVDGTGGFTGTDLEGETILSTGQYLTIVFESDVTITAPGFLAEVVCVSAGRLNLGLQQFAAQYGSNASDVREPKPMTEAQKVEMYRLQAESEENLEKKW